MQQRTRCIALLFASALFAWQLAAQNPGTLNGTVRDAAGKPLPNASVTATGPGGPPQTAVTKSDGTFSIANLPAGTYTVGVQASGYRNLS